MYSLSKTYEEYTWNIFWTSEKSDVSSYSNVHVKSVIDVTKGDLESHHYSALT